MGKGIRTKPKIAFILITACLAFVAAGSSNTQKKASNSQYGSSLFGEYASITKLGRYGTHLILEGELECDADIENINLMLVGPASVARYPLLSSSSGGKVSFWLSDKINNGIFLDAIGVSNYMAFIELECEEGLRHYNLANHAELQEIDYCSISNMNITKRVRLAGGNLKLEGEEDASYFIVKANMQALPEEVYDIVLDPGHGGPFSGAIGKLGTVQYKEKDLNLQVSILVAEKLREAGMKVALVRDVDRDVFPYGSGGRTVLCNELKAKYSFSIHFNSAASNQYQGTEIFIANNSDPGLAIAFADAIVQAVGYKYSNMVVNKIGEGVYNRRFNQADVEESAQTAAGRGYEPYPARVGDNYYFAVREPGGLTTGAWADGRDRVNGSNDFRGSSNTAEGLLLELGYVNNEENLKVIIGKKEEYAQGIVDGLRVYLENQHVNSRY